MEDYVVYFRKIYEIFTLKCEYSTKIYDVINLLKENNAVQKIIKVPKCDSVSESFREVGNRHYRETKYFDALENYNKCISYAASDEVLSFGYANRSLVYWKLKYYDKCLENIRLAKEAKYPAARLPILEKRGQQCLEIIQKMRLTPKFVAELSYPASAQHPTMAACLEVAVNEEYGRHIVTNQDLNVGDLVMLEKMLQIFVDNKCSYQNCANCSTENQLSLIPCPGCTKRMFCSQQCLDIFHENYHKYECPIVDYICETNHSHMLFALRILLTHLHEFGSIQALSSIWNTKKDPMTVLPCSGASDEATQKKKELEFFFSFTPVGEFKPQHAVELALIYTFLIENTKLKDKLVNEKERNDFLNFCCRYCLIITSNSFATDELKRDETGRVFNTTYGSNIANVMTLLSHSCAQNAGVKCYPGGMIGLMILRPVKKGNQLFMNYGANHYEKPRLERQQLLQTRYNFICRCVACLNNYPMENNLPIQPPPVRLMMLSMNEEQLLNKKQNKKSFELYKTYLQQNDRKYPSLDLYIVQRLIHRIYYALTGNCSIQVKIH